MNQERWKMLGLFVVAKLSHFCEALWGLGWTQKENMSLQSVAYLSPKHKMESSEGKHSTHEIWVEPVKCYSFIIQTHFIMKEPQNLFLFWF